MGTKENPGKFDCYDNAMPDEPMFILLARDPSAPELVEQWALKRDAAVRQGLRPQSDWAMVNEAMQCAVKMREWRAQHEGEWKHYPADVNRFEHLKRGTTYRRLTSSCTLQVSYGGEVGEDAVLTIYRSELDGAWYARPTGEFNDGRFAPLGDKE